MSGSELRRYTASVTSPGGRLCPRIRLPSRVVQLHLVALLVTIPATDGRGDATRLLERSGVVLGDCRPTLKAHTFRARSKANRLTACNGIGSGAGAHRVRAKSPAAVRAGLRAVTRRTRSWNERRR